MNKKTNLWRTIVNVVRGPCKDSIFGVKNQNLKVLSVAKQLDIYYTQCVAQAQALIGGPPSVDFTIAALSGQSILKTAEGSPPMRASSVVAGRGREDVVVFISVH